MKGRTKKVIISSLLVLTLLVAGCSRNNKELDTRGQEGNKLNVVTSFTIIGDMAEEIGGGMVRVHNLVPTGTDPHDYKAMPDDIKAATDADILFYNGLNLEGGKSGWFFKMLDSVGQENDNVFNLNDGVNPKYLRGEDGREEEVNPHSFISPKIGIKMAENLRDGLIKKNPENKEVYESNADNYLKKLKEIDERYRKTISSIPKEKRILVTSERAFQYMAEEYGLREGYIWEIDTEELGTVVQIKNLVKLLGEENPPFLFMESNVDTKPLETVSNESGIPIFNKPIYSDEIGGKGEEVDSYIKYLEYNIGIIREGLLGE